MRRGFTLIEIVIGLALSSLLAAALYSSLFQTQRTQSLVDSFSELDSSLLLIMHQLEHDFAGAVVFCEPKKQTKKEADKTKTLKQQFFGACHDDTFSIVTFLSTNPLSRYAVTTPRLVRIAYRLKKNQGNGLYSLMRQESDNLHWFSQREEEQPKPILLSGAIEVLSLDYIVTDTSGEKSEVKTYREWNSDAEKKDKKQPDVATPSYIGITLTMRDSVTSRSETVSCKFPIYSTKQWCYELKPQEKQVDQSKQQVERPKKNASVLPQGLSFKKQSVRPKKRTITLARPARGKRKS
ncbi:prepilin-type N-terminal cleavage/methylation domain-containing protein [Candidatus Babeliales bacterium]|nr:prepilin-type N-terminal cleavage/methylation domain-containing protein [Candidatus Babeliales bacterium]